jgi:hypothetical protein
VHATALIDAEISSVVRGLSITSKPEVQISADGKLTTAPGHTADVHQYPN